MSTLDGTVPPVGIFKLTDPLKAAGGSQSKIDRDLEVGSSHTGQPQQKVNSTEGNQS
jgi:hypothetical protein